MRKFTNSKHFGIFTSVLFIFWNNMYPSHINFLNIIWCHTLRQCQANVWGEGNNTSIPDSSVWHYSTYLTFFGLVSYCSLSNNVRVTCCRVNLLTNYTFYKSFLIFVPKSLTFFAWFLSQRVLDQNIFLTVIESASSH